MTVSRRDFVRRLGLATAAGAAAPTLWTELLAQPERAARAAGTITALEPPDELGIRLPAQYSARLVARSGDDIFDTGHRWHDAPDGGATFTRPDGGWTYVSNSEVRNGGGGASALSFDNTGEVVGAATLLRGTSRNCAGGPTPWGTWLSCEETTDGQVWECDPSGVTAATLRPALGTFRHEAVAIDLVNGDVYLTEDQPDGRLYRFVPTRPGDLSEGQLFAARTSRPPHTLSTGEVTAVAWQPASSNQPARSATTAEFSGGEGAWIDRDQLTFTTKGDDRVWQVDLGTQQLSLLHDCIARPETPLGGVDNVTVHTPTGAIVIAEDQGDMQLCVLRSLPGGLTIDVLLQVVGHDGSELTGPAFSPDGSRLYFSSQRGLDGQGLTYEVNGPFDFAPPFIVDQGAPNRSLEPAQRLRTNLTP